MGNRFKKNMAIILIVTLFVALICGIISDSFYTNKLNNILANNDKIEKITADMSDIQMGDSSKSIIIIDRKSLDTVAYLLKQNIEYVPTQENNQSAFMNLYIYKKNQKAGVQAYRLKYGGWGLCIGEKWYKNDSLILILQNHFSTVKAKYTK